MENFLRIFLTLYLVIYIATAFVWRSYLVWRRTGVNPYVLGNSDSAHDYIGLLFRLTLAANGLIVLLFVFSDAAYRLLMPIEWLQSRVLQILGIVLLVASLLWILVAQAQMGNAWRIGIDNAHDTQLVREGVFKISRNPIFLGMRITLLGFFLLLPTALSFAVLLLGEALINVQVRLEEEHLLKLHGQRYDIYRKETRRWL